MTRVEWLFRLTWLFLAAAVIGFVKFVIATLAFAVWAEPMRAMFAPLVTGLGFLVAYQVSFIFYDRAVFRGD
jgi:hypothetical protein